ncbi:MAG: hypothetical protein ACRDO9_00450, partial [Gaiellales bacterium]
MGERDSTSAEGGRAFRATDAAQSAGAGRRSTPWRQLLAAIAVAALAVAALGGLWVKTRGVSFHPLYQESLQPGELGTVAVASPEDALTFAREAGSAGRVIAVTRYEAGYVEGVDLGRVLGRRVRDPRVVFRALGYS